MGASDGGRAAIAPLITAQTCSGNKYGYIKSEVPWAQLQINLDDPTRALCLGPTYDGPYAADGVHLSSEGQEKQGARAAVALNAWLRGELYKPLHATAAVRTSATVRLTLYNHFALPLVLDTVSITGLGPDHGFTWEDAGDGNTVTVTAVTIINATTVDLTLSAIPTGSNARILIAMNGTSGAAAGPATGNRASLRTSGSGITTRGGTAVEHYICIAPIPVTT